MSDAPASSDQQNPATAVTSSATATSASTQARFGWPLRAVFAVGGMILGAVVGMVVQAAVSTTGVLGPGMEDLINEQSASFQKLEAKIDTLRTTSDPVQIKSISAELQTLLTDQQRLAQRANEELRGARAEIDRLKEQAFEASGAAGGADLWLKPGESVSVGQAGTVLSLVNYSGPTSGTRTTRVVMNVAGESKTLAVGDAAQMKVGNETFKIIYKQTAPRADGRVGFDVVKE